MQHQRFTRQGEDEVNVAGGQQLLFACLEPAETREEAYLCTQVAGIASDLKQGRGTGLEEQVIDHALVLEREGSETRRRSARKRGFDQVRLVIEADPVNLVKSLLPAVGGSIVPETCAVP
jgi:hypothetical protein